MVGKGILGQHKATEVRMRGEIWGAGGSVQLQFSVAGVGVMAKDQRS